MKRIISCLVILLSFIPGLHSQSFDVELFKAIQARNIGPGGMSGRVTSIDVRQDKPSEIWVGTASGGLWKSESGGQTWTPVFDKEKVAGIGAVAIDQNKPDVIWVGTGEGNPRNSITGGFGLYKSLDGGRSWKLAGLEKTRHIHRIIIHPQNSDIVYAGAIGSPWGPHPERGVYKTTDGGKTWKQILFVNESTGVADMIMDPANPDKLFVAMWEHHRQPWFFKSGGKGSGLYRTVDGGENWEQITDRDGLPKGEIGRIGLAISKSKPDYVYALIESNKNAIYRSEDGGYKWSRRGTENIGDRPFYYADIFVDPSNENRLYSLFSRVNISDDGGMTFSQLLGREIHSDHHAWYIHPDNPSFMIDGNDGGLAITYDMGETWEHVMNLPVSQFYHINYDMETPYYVYGGMQDNGSWRGPAYIWSRNGIINTYWDFLQGGDGFDVVPVPGHPDMCYAMSQEGYVQRHNFRTGHSVNIRPVHPEGVELRFHWNAAISQDPFDPNTIYFGSQFVHKSTDRGDSWTIISPDLTTNDPEKQIFKESGGLTYDVTGAENHTCILAITPSPLKKDMIWVGTDDGNIQLTQDGGKTWTNMISRIKDYPSGCWVPQIVASGKNEGEAFVVVNNYRQNDYKPYLYHTTNFGKNWERLVDETDVWGYVLSVAQDPVEPDLIFLGTEFGLFVSIDAGKNWTQWKTGYPTVSTIDLKIHPRENDLIIGTFGRSAWILDDITPLRELARQGPGMLDRTLQAFEPPLATMAYNKSAPGYYFTGDSYFEGDNRQMGAMLSVYVKEGVKREEGSEAGNRPGNFRAGMGGDSGRRGPGNGQGKDSLSVQIFNDRSEMVREIKMVPEPGLNRFTWRFDTRGFKLPGGSNWRRRGGGDGGGPSVPPGVYTLKYKYKGDSTEVKLQVVPDPREPYDIDAKLARFEAIKPLIENLESLAKSMDKLNECKSAMETVKKLSTKEQDEQLKDATRSLKGKLDPLYEKLYGKQNQQGIVDESYMITQKLSRVYSIIWSDDPLNPTEEMVIDQSLKLCRETVSEIEDFISKNWTAYRTEVEKAGVSIFK